MKCDRVVDGGAFCNQNKETCEGLTCDGQWCTNGDIPRKPASFTVTRNDIGSWISVEIGTIVSPHPHNNNPHKGENMKVSLLLSGNSDKYSNNAVFGSRESAYRPFLYAAPTPFSKDATRPISDTHVLSGDDSTKNFGTRQTLLVQSGNDFHPDSKVLLKFKSTFDCSPDLIYQPLWLNLYVIALGHDAYSEGTPTYIEITIMKLKKNYWLEDNATFANTNYDFTNMKTFTIGQRDIGKWIGVEIGALLCPISSSGNGIGEFSLVIANTSFGNFEDPVTFGSRESAYPPFLYVGSSIQNPIRAHEPANVALATNGAEATQSSNYNYRLFHANQTLCFSKHKTLCETISSWLK